MEFKRYDLERKVLYLIMKKKDILSKICDKIDKMFFASRKTRTIFVALFDYYKSSKHILSKDMILDKLKEAGADSRKISKYKLLFKQIKNEKEDVIETDIEYYLEVLGKLSKVRQAFKAMKTGTDMIENKKIDLGLKFLQSQITKINQDDVNRVIREGDYFEGIDFRENYMKEQKRKKRLNLSTGIPIGISNFDNYFGGLCDEELGVIIGGPGKGKSVLLLNNAIMAYLRGYPVVIATIEMPKLQYELRMDSRLTGILTREIRLGTIKNKSIRQWKKKLKRYKEKRKNRIWIIDIPRGATSEVLRLKLFDAIREVGSHFLLVVDYLNIMKPATRGLSSTDWMGQAEIVRDLKEIAREFHIPVWTAAQPTKKSVEKKDALEITDMGLSFQIAFYSDIGLALFQTKEDELDDIVRLQCIKGREGNKMHTAKLHTAFDRMLINVNKFKSKKKK